MLRLRSYSPYMAGLRLLARRMHLMAKRFTTLPEGAIHVWSLSHPMACNCDSNAILDANYIGHARHVVERSPAWLAKNPGYAPKPPCGKSGDRRDIPGFFIFMPRKWGWREAQKKRRSGSCWRGATWRKGETAGNELCSTFFPACGKSLRRSSAAD